MAKKAPRKRDGAPAKRERSPRPIASMTGFGRGTAPADPKGGSVRVDIVAVNHRYLKLTLKMPEPLQALRQRIESAVREHAIRGSITVTIHYAPPPKRASQLVDRDRLATWVEAIDRAAKPLGLERPKDWSVLATIPDLFRNDDPATLDRREAKRIVDAVSEAANGLADDRRREGRALVRDVSRRLKTIAKSVKAIERAAPRVVRAFSDRLHERMTELLKRAGVRAELPDLLQEVAVFAERVDISEEITRLHAHLGHFDDILAAGGECGKRIDFLLQEIQREVNTIGSKAGNTDISPHVVTVKGEVEKIREQVQNIE